MTIAIAMSVTFSNDTNEIFSQILLSLGFLLNFVFVIALLVKIVK
jgi:hypothetical protein